ncbi:hypothetical protein LTR10_018175 [Elasticomyces elasticus]|uniref:Myb-like DNA-binding domain-containing protein n=1 Tax=Exophiala sideris TaxID=1016849 RepID=A0ABR0J2L6_9EURO|nr:hypothetical protein LTR10_018175 [Elasticomyces elasticus]KAK5024945.1 hypothetical protein LTS07_008323 [Exophiala sideris]KAK5031466.1 hypothetical protein LTR13_007794 [Exophiala sideris]KAK5054983.1 hypothetical protein LTR69_008551 [Exophiala sideris]KAK5179864.1 hypothetical protein LTR44_007680 [Eurotiomycetes sp. CCFEE 6388]
MANATAEEKLSYVLNVLMHTEMPKPDYHAVAQDNGITSANNAQKKFRAIVKSAGYDLVDGRIVSDSGNGTAAAPSTTPSTPTKKSGGKASVGAGAKKTPAKKATAGPATSKKRKIDESAGDSGMKEEHDTTENIKEEHETTLAPADDSLDD